MYIWSILTFAAIIAAAILEQTKRWRLIFPPEDDVIVDQISGLSLSLSFAMVLSLGTHYLWENINLSVGVGLFIFFVLFNSLPIFGGVKKTKAYPLANWAFFWSFIILLLWDVLPLHLLGL